MAYYRKVQNGWRAQVERLGVRASNTLPTKAQAEAWALAEEAAILAGKRGQFPARTLREAVKRYQVEVTDKKAAKKPKVARADNLRFEAWLRDFPELADKVFHQITGNDLATWRDKRLQVVSQASVLREAQQFRPVWTLAIRQWKWAGASPWKDITLPPKGHARRKKTLWQQIRQIVRSGGYRTGRPPALPQTEAMWAYLVALHTSMRSAEILRMSRSTVDLKRRVYHLTRHKTDDDVGDRIVPLTRRVEKLLRVLDAAAAAAGRDAYFTVTDESRDVNFRKVRDRLMIEGLTFHDSRAAALTWLSKRYDVMTLAKISGHKNIQELYNTYYRETEEEIAARL